MIRAPRRDELRLLPQIENAADGRYARVGLQRVIGMPPASLIAYLSTYRDVPWNGPHYARRGFEEMPRTDWPHVFRVQFTIENGHRHPPWRRAIMRRGLAPHVSSGDATKGPLSS